MNNIAVTGFYGTGSSAVIDLLEEFQNTAVAIGARYEHNLFCCHDGIIELANRLFSDSSNFMTRDAALNAFLAEMEKQSKNDFTWYGSYEKLFGKEFMHSVTQFIEAISTKGQTKGFSHTTGTRFSLMKGILQIGAKILMGRRIAKFGRVYTYDKKPTRYLTVDQESFIREAKGFVGRYFSMCSVADKQMVYDHILLPEQTAAVDFFGNNFRLVILTRDPRDVYTSAYHIWNSAKFGFQRPPFPGGIENFCNTWNMLHENAYKNLKSEQTIIMQFEDFIYNYEDAVQRLCEFCGLEKSEHIDKKSKFKPENSLYNTQVFRLKPSYQEESEYIKEHCKYSIYDFPYELEGDNTKIFE